MMFFLVLDIANDLADLRVPVRERAVAFLPTEPSWAPSLTVDEIRRVGFDFLHQVGDRHAGPEPEENMRVVRHAMNGEEFLPLVLDDAGDVFVEFLFVCLADQ